MRISKGMKKSDLCYLYDTMYSGNSITVLHKVRREDLSDSDIGFLCRYASEYYLHWGPEKAMRMLSDPVLQKMKLLNLVKEMKLPPEFSPPEKNVYLCTLMYPEYLKGFTKEYCVTAFCQSVLAGYRKEFPRCFFSGGYGAEQNARICLIYVLQAFAGCRTGEDCVRFMSSQHAVTFLKEARLYYVMKRRYKTPIAYVNDALAFVGMLDPGKVCPNIKTICRPEQLCRGR